MSSPAPIMYMGLFQGGGGGGGGQEGLLPS